MTRQPISSSRTKGGLEVSSAGSTTAPLRPVVPEASVTVASSWESTAFMCWRSKEGTRAPRGGSAGNAGRSWSSGDFTIGGNAPDLFYPGTSEPLDLAITNPFKFAIKVLSVSVTVEPVPAKRRARPRLSRRHQPVGDPAARGKPGRPRPLD